MRERVIKTVGANRRIISLFIMSSVAIYFILRLIQGSQYVLPYFIKVANIVLSRNPKSYDEKMLSEKGTKYLYSKKIEEVTPEDAVICFWAGDRDLDASIGAYFLYPRFTKEITEKGTTALKQIKELGCTYVFINDGNPNFDLRVKRIILFGDTVEKQPVFMNLDLYSYTDQKYLNMTGILEL